MKAKPAPLNAPLKTTEVKPIPAPEAKPPELHVSSENAQESFISHFLSRGHIEHRFRKENASLRQETALKRKPIEGNSRTKAPGNADETPQAF